MILPYRSRIKIWIQLQHFSLLWRISSVWNIVRRAVFIYRQTERVNRQSKYVRGFQHFIHCCLELNFWFLYCLKKCHENPNLGPEKRQFSLEQSSPIWDEKKIGVQGSKFFTFFEIFLKIIESWQWQIKERCSTGDAGWIFLTLNSVAVSPILCHVTVIWHMAEITRLQLLLTFSNFHR